MIDVTAMLMNLSESLGGVSKLVSGAAYVIGVAFFFKALYRLKIYGELRTMMASNTNIMEPLMYIFVGMIFIFLPTGFSMVMQTTFGYANPLAYQSWPSAGGANIGPGAVALLRLVQLVGLVAFIRGWMYLAKSTGQGAQGGMGKGLTHILGGLAAMNIVGTARVISATLGVSL